MNNVITTLRQAGEIYASWTESRLAEAVTRCSVLDDALTAAGLVVEGVATPRNDAGALKALNSRSAPKRLGVATEPS
jgi:hypothetical protein